MASRVVEILYKLKDLFTPTAKKIEKAYDDLGRSSKEAGEKIDETNKAVGGTLGKLQGRFRGLAALAKGGAIGTAIAQFTSLVGDAVDGVLSLDREARQLGLTAQEFLDLRDIAAETNVPINELEKSFGSINSRLTAFQRGSKLAAKQFEALGINAEKFAQLDAGGQLERLSAALLDLGNSQDAAATVATLLGVRPDSDLIRFLERGPAQVRETAEAAKDLGQELGGDTIENARRLERVAEQTKNFYQQAGGFLANLLTDAAGSSAEALGLGDTRRQALRRQQEDLQAQIKDAEERLARVDERNTRLRTRLTKELDNYRRAEQEVADQLKSQLDAQLQQERESDQRVEDIEIQQEAEDEFRQSLQETTDAFTEYTKKQSANLRQQRREYADARRDQISVEREFQRLLDDITGVDVTAEDVTLGDVFGRLNQAQSAAERGNLEEAVSLALEGADYLTLLKEKGTETQGTLGFLATQLAQVANQSAKARAEIEKGDVTGAEAVQESLAAQKTAIEGIGEDTGRAFGRSVVASAQQFMDANPVVPRVAQTPAATQGSGYIEWANDPGSRKYVDGKIVK